MKRTSTLSQSGMTLMEVMIATAILAVIAAYTAETVQRAVKSKIKVEGDIDRKSTVRDALRIIERDVNLAFHYRDIGVQLYNISEKERLERLKKGTKTPEDPQKKDPPPSGDPPPPPPSPTEPTKPFKPKKQKIFTHFMGEENRMDFTTLNYARIREDDRSSDQAEIGYFLRDCRNRYDKTKSSQCLWRRIDPLIDDDVTKGGTETVLLEHVLRFELRYLGPGKEEEWTKQWKTNKGGDANSENNFPYAVEITLEYHNKTIPSEKPVSMTLVAAVRFPNNPTKEEKNAEAKNPTDENPDPAQ
ncbi:MAG: prepilin-type N-terminal cleavage/methylation domain-containing protein [Bdellovibrionales bacterium]|nr:prepilin-type N-terminal cleavage/methylation domain-containing protein [Bdellovibrionales bacterium]